MLLGHVCRNGIEDKIGILCGVSKRMGGFVVRLIAIEYKEDSFCYLSSYPDLILDETYSPKPSRILDPFQQSEPCPDR